MTSGVRPIDMILLDELFEMGGGYVLDFSDRTMREFFAQELNVDIDDPRYARNGTSKAKRLRTFLTMVDPPTAVRTLRALWDYRQAINARRGAIDSVANGEGRLLELIGRLEGKPVASETAPSPAFKGPLIAQARKALLAIWDLAPQQRGYAFERFLRDTFQLFGLMPRDSFRLRGEQIDGSFDLAGHTYLLEAKWEAKPTPAADLHIFEGKLGEKAAWSRGLFVSYIGFSEDGLHAFGRGKRVICMSGEDFDAMFEKQLPIDEVLRRKARRFAETGNPYVRVRDLF